MSSNASIARDTIDDPHDRELQVLEHIAQASVVRQRDIARIVGVSLGMANSILKRLARKGLITIRKINNRNVMYAVSPRGLDQIARRSYRYLRRTIKNVVAYRRTIESLIALVASQGFDQVTLVDESDLDFIVEHACDEAGLGFRRVRGHDVAGGTTTAGSENRQDPVGPDRSRAGAGASDEQATGPAFLLHSERYGPPAGRRRLDDIERTITGGACEAYLSELLI
jgi:DNA-binding MarR family transcriptional regulator